jgi:hypothetical protein
LLKAPRDQSSLRQREVRAHAKQRSAKRDSRSTIALDIFTVDDKRHGSDGKDQAQEDISNPLPTIDLI